MNTLFAIDYPTRADADLGLAQARDLQQAGGRQADGLTILDAVLAPTSHEAAAGEGASLLVLAADTGNEEAVIAALAVLGGDIRHAAIAPYAGPRIREASETRPARAEPEVQEAVASLDRG